VANYVSKNVNESVTLAVLVTKAGSGITGLTPTLELRRNSDGLYFDFGATTAPYWVASGGQQTMVLPESAWQDGYYGWVFDHEEYDQGNLDEYTAIYRNVGGYPFVEIEVVSFANRVAADITLIRQILANDQDLECAGSYYLHRVYDDLGASGGTVVHEKKISLNGSTEERRDP